MIEIIDKQRRKCQFCDGENKTYSLDQIQSYSKYRGITDVNDDDDNGSSKISSSEKNDSSSDDEISANQGVDDGDEGSDAESNRNQVRAAQVTSGKYWRKILKFTLTESEARPSDTEALKNSMSPTISTVEENFRKLNIDGHPIEFRKYPEEADTKVLTNTILAYYSEYRQEI